MAFVNINDYDAMNASVINHGSAAGPTVTAAPLPSAAGSLTLTHLPTGQALEASVPKQVAGSRVAPTECL